MEAILQYFDGCPNWKKVDALLRILQSEGFDLDLKHQLINTPEDAHRHNFRGSPTITLNGVDPFADPDAPIGLTCRIYMTETGLSGMPSIGQLREAVASRARPS